MKNPRISLIIILIILIAPVFLYSALKTSSQHETQSIEAISAQKPTIIDFSSEMCLECKELKKVSDPIVNKYKDKINFVVIMINSGNAENQKLIKKYNVKVVPTLVYIDKNGCVIKKTEGSMSSKEFERNIRKLIDG